MPPESKRYGGHRFCWLRGIIDPKPRCDVGMLNDRISQALVNASECNVPLGAFELARLASKSGPRTPLTNAASFVECARRLTCHTPPTFIHSTIRPVPFDSRKPA